MKFLSHEDKEAPAQAVFAALSDHEQFQRVMQQRGVSMRRVDDCPEVGPGMAWEIDFKFRGRTRKLRCLVTEVQGPERLCLSNESDGLTGDVSILVLTLAPQRSRVLVSVEMKPKTSRRGFCCNPCALQKFHYTENSNLGFTIGPRRCLKACRSTAVKAGLDQPDKCPKRESYQ